MPTVNMHEAKTQLSKLVEAALAGEDVVIAKAGEPAVRLVPVQRERREFGSLAGTISKEELEALLAPLPDEVIESFYSSDDDDELLMPEPPAASRPTEDR
jgi:prevent-host-death family protein